MGKNKTDIQLGSKKGATASKALGFGIALIAVIIVVGVSWVLYRHTVNLMTQNLHHRLEAIVRTAAVQFDAQDLDQLREEPDYLKPEWNRVVTQLINIRENNDDIVFAYILRKREDDPTQMDFVADSHSLDPYAKIDLDGNGIIDDSDALTPPGTIYEDVPEESFIGYTSSTTNKELYEDQWGVLLSGYAPIKYSNGETAAVMTIDIRADDFFTITSQTLYPFLIFIGVLVVILFVLVTVIIRIWNKRVEFMAELDKQKDELLSIVSHQLATPVSSTKWYLEMMIDGDFGKLSDEQEKHVKSMQGVVGNLADLVSMILDVSRIQLGRMKVDLADLDLSEAINEILVVIEPKAKERNAKLNVSLPKELPVAKLDKRLIRMTLENLLSNAVKYSDKDAGEVEFTVEVANGTLTYSVKDNGCGIPEKEQDKIFGKLFRASNIQSIDGNGFGLYAAKGAVEALGGSIRFESTENKGTTFFVSIPLNK
ncbi:hypothetical protein CL635_01020 [bacterium]|nr:hypothetical protein [bacterium]|tara:strand:- start:8386 stop:9834 length:1449 start_codon:yes stop_codon:yes gene_type:complete